MTDLIHVTPAAGLRVLDPAETPPQPLPAAGKTVQRSPYWSRRALDGDITIALPPTAKPATKGKE